MSKFWRNRRLTGLLFLIYAAPVMAGANHVLIVKIEGFENDRGKAMIALCDSELNFNSETKPFRSAIADISNKTTSVSFDDLISGEYAIKTFHDENSDESLNTGFLGIPTEAYGFSNNARGQFGPADWEDAKFILNQDTLTIKIRIK